MSDQIHTNTSRHQQLIDAGFSVVLDDDAIEKIPKIKNTKAGPQSSRKNIVKCLSSIVPNVGIFPIFARKSESVKALFFCG